MKLYQHHNWTFLIDNEESQQYYAAAPSSLKVSPYLPPDLAKFFSFLAIDPSKPFATSHSDAVYYFFGDAFTQQPFSEIDFYEKDFYTSVYIHTAANPMSITFFDLLAHQRV